MGRLKVATSQDVVSYTRVTDLQNLLTVEPNRLQLLVDSAEGAMDRYADYDMTKAGAAEDMKRAACILVERLFLQGDEDFTTQDNYGLTEFDAGAYKEKRGREKRALYEGEVWQILNYYATRFKLFSPVSYSRNSNPFSEPFDSY